MLYSKAPTSPDAPDPRLRRTLISIAAAERTWEPASPDGLTTGSRISSTSWPASRQAGKGGRWNCRDPMSEVRVLTSCGADARAGALTRRQAPLSFHATPSPAGRVSSASSRCQVPSTHQGTTKQCEAPTDAAGAHRPRRTNTLS